MDQTPTSPASATACVARMAGAPTAQGPSQITYGVASHLEQVVSAWHLVYQCYRRIALIDPNPHEIHTTPQAVSPGTAVILGCVAGTPVSTLSCIRDGADGLPLDGEYHDELDELRDQGRMLTEIGLLADRREHMARSADSLIMLMHYSVDYSFRDQGSDAIIGVHPRHSRFYQRFFGFEQFGSERTYAVVNDRPVVLLRLTKESFNTLDPLPRGLRYLHENPVPDKQYEGLYPFNEAEVWDSPLGAYLRSQSAAPLVVEAALAS